LILEKGVGYIFARCRGNDGFNQTLLNLKTDVVEVFLLTIALSIDDFSVSTGLGSNKDMNFPCTTAAFTLSPAPGGLRHLVLTRPGTEPSMRFLSVGSHLRLKRLLLVRSGFLQTTPREAALAVG